MPEDDDGEDTEADQHDLAHGRLGLIPVQARDQIRHGDIEEAGRRHRQRVGGQHGHQRQCHHGEQGAGRAGQPREPVEQQRPPAAVAGVQQDGEVADFIKLPYAEIAELILKDQLTPDAAAVTAEFILRQVK